MIIAQACTSKSAKENINKAGDAAGQAVGELAEGIKSGVQKAFDVKIETPASFAARGLKLGKTSVKNDTAGTDNLLMVYIIFDKKFEGNIVAKAFDSKGMEMGRAKVWVKGTQGDAKYFDFHFDKRTNIDSDSKLELE